MTYLSRLKAFFDQQSVNFRVMLTRSFFIGFFNGLTQNFTSVYIVELGADTFQLGMVRSLGSVVNSALSGIVGWLVDKYSLKKMFLVGMILECLVPLTYALSQNWLMVIIPGILFSMTMVVTWPIESILRANSVRDDWRATGFGILGAVSQMVGLFAPSIGGLIVVYMGGLSATGIRPLFYIHFIGLLGLMVWVYQKLERAPAATSPKTSILKDLREVIAGRGDLKRWMIMDVLGSFIWGATMPFTMIYAKEVKGADAVTIGPMGSAMSLIFMLTSIPIGRLADTLGRRKAIYLSRPFFYLSTILFIIAPNPVILIIAFALRGIFWSSMGPWSSMSLEMVEREQRGRWFGILNISRSLVRIPAPIVGSLLWNWISPEAPFLMLILIDLLIRMPLLKTVPETRVSS